MNNYRHVPIIQVDPVVLVDHPSDTGEGPLWDDVSNTLTWNDIPSGTLFRYDPAGRTNTVIYQHTGSIGGHTLQADGSLMLFGDNGAIHKMVNGAAEVIVDEIPAVVGSRFNDVIADPLGNVFCGTMPLAHKPAQLFRLDVDGSLDLIWDDLGLGNGMGFSPDEKTFYHSDSNNRVVYRADYADGELSNRNVLIRLDDEYAVPDGIAVDAAGDIWLAVWDGSSLLHYTATGELIDRVMFPVRKVSSLSFGGIDFGTAFVTTAGGRNRDGDDGPLAGSLFAVNIPGVRGKSDYRSRILL